jgi:4-hydroxy-2-oxoheptanedioate aldolase
VLRFGVRRCKAVGQGLQECDDLVLFPIGDKPDEWMMTALKKVLDGCKRHKVQPGIHCGAPAYAKKMIEMGFTFVTVGGDTRFVTMGGQAAVAEMRSGAPARPATGSTSPY